MNHLKASEPIIEINQALNGLEGKEIQLLANKIIEIRQKVLKKLTNQPMRTPILCDELKDFTDEYLETKFQKTAINSTQTVERSKSEEIEQEPIDYPPISALKLMESTEISQLKKDLNLIRSNIVCKY